MKSKNLFLYIIGMIFISEITSAQITFQKTYGGTGNDQGLFVQQTTDGGYIIAGSTNSYGAGNYDLYLIKTDVNGDTLWTKTFGGINNDYGRCVKQTIDGGYIIVGYINGSLGVSYDVYLIKTDSIGDTLWTKTYGGTETDFGFSVYQTLDGGYIITGSTNSFGSGSGFKVYLIRTDTIGNLMWTKTFGECGSESAGYVQQTTDGGYITVGNTYCTGAGGYDVFLIKTDFWGDTLWIKTFGGTNYDGSDYGLQTTDGGYIIVGNTSSFGAGNADVYLIKTDSLGDLLWTKTFGGTGEDGGVSLQQTSDGGYIIVGYTFSFGAGSADVYLIKTDSNGDSLWTKTIGGIKYDIGYSVQQTTDGGYIITGYTFGFSAGVNNADIFLIKTDSSGNAGCNEGNPATIESTTATQTTSPGALVSSGDSITILPTIVGSGGTVTTLCTTVGIQSEILNPKSEISISPNPFHTSTALTINNNFSLKDLTLKIFNVEGKTIRQFPVTSHKTIFLREGLAAGVYFYQLTDGGVVKSIGKLLIQ